jgi:hypothetical protein
MASRDQDEDEECVVVPRKRYSRCQRCPACVHILDSNSTGIASTSGYTVEEEPCLSELAAAARK